MAEIWFCSEAGRPIQDEQVDERPFAECVDLLGLTAERYLGEDPTGAGAVPAEMAPGDKYLVVAVDIEEAEVMGWRPGYYPSPLEPAQGLERLGIDPADVLDT
jgi:hypothetical protein